MLHALLGFPFFYFLNSVLVRSICAIRRIAITENTFTMIMKRSLLFVLFLATLVSTAWSQILEPAKWTIRLEPAKPEVGQEATLIAEVRIDKDWYVYGSDFDPELGPLVTELNLSESTQGIELIDKLRSIDSKRKYDDLWGG
jgi:thiol:disulfide interchange protein DsbD